MSSASSKFFSRAACNRPPKRRTRPANGLGQSDAGCLLNHAALAHPSRIGPSNAAPSAVPCSRLRTPLRIRSVQSPPADAAPSYSSRLSCDALAGWLRRSRPLPSAIGAHAPTQRDPPEGGRVGRCTRHPSLRLPVPAALGLRDRAQTPARRSSRRCRVGAPDDAGCIRSLVRKAPYAFVTPRRRRSRRSATSPVSDPWSRKTCAFRAFPAVRSRANSCKS